MLFRNCQFTTKRIIMEFFYHVGVCLLGVGTKIVRDIKLESDKFQDLKDQDFDIKHYFNKNQWDFVFYVMSGLVVLTMKSLLKSYVPIEGLTDISLSGLSGLMGAAIISKLITK